MSRIGKPAIFRAYSCLLLGAACLIVRPAEAPAQAAESSVLAEAPEPGGIPLPSPSAEQVPAYPAGPPVDAGWRLPTALDAAWERCPPPPPTCTSCADRHLSECEPAAGPLHRAWRNRWKPFLQETHWGYCNYFDEPPVGMALKQALGAQVSEGLRSRLALFQYDFYASDGPQPAELNERGREQLAKIAGLLAMAPLPVIVEQTPGQPELSALRRVRVHQELERLGIPLPDNYVVLCPVRNGLIGAEAVIIYNNLLEQTRLRGLPLSSDSGGGGEAPSVAPTGG